MHKVGLINKWLVDTLPKRDQCWTSTQLEVTNHKVNLDDMQGSFIVLLLGELPYTNTILCIMEMIISFSLICLRCIIVIGFVFV